MNNVIMKKSMMEGFLTKEDIDFIDIIGDENNVNRVVLSVLTDALKNAENGEEEYEGEIPCDYFLHPNLFNDKYSIL